MNEFQTAVVVVVVVVAVGFSAFYSFAAYVDKLAEISAEKFQTETEELITRLNKIS